MLVKKVLALEEVRQAVLAFHIPVPNHFIQNAVSEEEFSKLQASYGPWKEKVAYLLCGHVHSCFVDVYKRQILLISGSLHSLCLDLCCFLLCD